jgi:hypothetical protein
MSRAKASSASGHKADLALGLQDGLGLADQVIGGAPRDGPGAGAEQRRGRGDAAPGRGVALALPGVEAGGYAFAGKCHSMLSPEGTGRSPGPASP